MSESTTQATAIRADLHHIIDGVNQVASRYEGFQAGGGGEVERTAANFSDASVTPGEGGAIEVTFDRVAGRVDAISPLLGFPKNWRDYGALRAVVTNGDHPLLVELIVIGARSRLIEPRFFAAGESAEIVLDLRDLPLTAGSRAAYEPTGVRLTAVWSADGGEPALTDWQREYGRDEIDAEGPVTLTVHELTLEPRRAAVEPVVDRYGQRASAAWPGKVTDTDQLREHREAEAERLAEMETPSRVNEYGGWLDGPQLEATGFFRTHQDEGGRWWYVDPTGRLFWSIGTTGIRLTDDTTISGREQLYASLPPREGPEAEAWHADDSIGLYKWNVVRKYDGDLQAWADRVALRWKKWGFNTVGSWSQLDLMTRSDPRLVYTVFMHSRNENTPMTSKRFPDVFDAKWVAEMDRIAAEATAGRQDDPWLLGYFVDNESSWRNPRLLEAGDTAIRQRWEAFARERFADVAAFNECFGTTCGDWAEVRALRHEHLPDLNGETESPAAEAMHAFNALYAEQYFKVINESIKRHDPNHLYLGCRFVRQAPDDRIVAAAGRHCDVITVNSYDLYPKPEQFGGWYEAGGGKPLMLGEHHLPLMSDRQLPPIYAAFTPQERIAYYIQAQRKWLAQPYSVGAHWFQHADQHLTGRGMDGENQTVGFVDITDQPHEHLVEAARQVTSKMYSWHNEAE